jgi:hypothetical protein
MPPAAIACGAPRWNQSGRMFVFAANQHRRRYAMGFGRGALLWMLGIPLPIILLLAFFWH